MISEKIDKGNMDLDVRPQDDFFEYANGGWLKKNEIPADQSKWGSFYVLREEVVNQVKDLISELNKKELLDGSDEQKVRDFYTAGMDEEKINKEGAAPALPFLEKIQNMRADGVMEQISDMHFQGFDPFFHLLIEQDEKDATKYIPYFYQGGIGMPDRDYYLKDDEKSLEIQKEYKKLIARLLELFKYEKENINKNVELIYALEKRLALASMDKVDLRDPYKRYFKKDFETLTKELPLFSWQIYFDKLKIPKTQDIILSQPDFFKEVEAIINTESLENLKIYLAWSVILDVAPFLSDDFVHANFEFYGKTLSGLKEMKPRWKRVISSLDGALGFALGKIYVEKHFSENAKYKMKILVQNILEAMEEHIKSISWMSAETKANAFKKLQTFDPKLGYPDKWQDYSKLSVGSNYLENVLKASEFETNRLIGKLGTPIDRTEWLMTPHTVNAYYQPTMNEIVFPAAILQAPFFNEASEDALNYGGIGSVIAHEITHGFDDRGSEYDELGNLKKWWTEEDRKKFDERTNILVEQFNSIFPLPDMHINGELTLGENIADLGGVILAYDAYIKSREGKEEPPVVDGLTDKQRFFLRFAECECVKAREEMLRQQLIVDPHSPSKYRVNAVLAHVEPFYEVFNVTEKDPMYLPSPKRAKIW